MKLVVAVQQVGSAAHAVALLFEAWDQPEATRVYGASVQPGGKPARGEPDLREVACVLQLLDQCALQPELIVIDGLVHLDAAETPAMGHQLYQALSGRTAVIGVSKTLPPELPAQFHVMREDEAPAIAVTCAGIDLASAKARLRAMHGRKRLPTLLKLAARLAKSPP